MDSLSRKRLFLAVIPPKEAKERLSEYNHKYRHIKFIPKDNLHLTLKFLGQVEREKELELAALLAEVQGRPFALAWESLGFFKRPGQAVFWAGFSFPPQLGTLKKDLDEKLAAWKDFKPDKRFQPHVTLARLKRPAPELEKEAAGFKADPKAVFKVSVFHLVESLLRPEGAVYKIQQSYELF